MSNVKNRPSSQFVEDVITKNSLHKVFMKHAWDLLSEEEKDVFDTYISYFQSQNKDIPFLVNSYNLFISDTMKEQFYFKRHGKYRYNKLDDVLTKVYLNEPYMEKYMAGLIMSNFIWPNHVHIRRWFFEKFPRNKKGIHLEVGPGHGYYFIESMKIGAFDAYHAIDISPKSLSFVDNLIKSNFYGTFANYKLMNGDFLKEPASEKYDSLVMGEVIEHVERPLDFLKRARSLIIDNGFIFLTTAINAPEIDHIYLFDTLESVTSMIEQAGLKIKDTLVLPYHGTNIERSVKEKLPINIALELTT
jgi:2-polyprenyl-3-methyl-5-hydroxy-6-metoxy-1,4-benzoquinol methylase